VRDGSTIFLCLDWWHPDGVLVERWVYHVVYDSGSKLEGKLSSVMRGNEWTLFIFKASCLA
jgi:hypothetical protein